MADELLRRVEREAARGDPAARARLLHARRRAGDLREALALLGELTALADRIPSAALRAAARAEVAWTLAGVGEAERALALAAAATPAEAEAEGEEVAVGLGGRVVVRALGRAAAARARAGDAAGAVEVLTRAVLALPPVLAESGFVVLSDRQAALVPCLEAAAELSRAGAAEAPALLEALLGAIEARPAEERVHYLVAAAPHLAALGERARGVDMVLEVLDPLHGLALHRLDPLVEALEALAPEGRLDDEATGRIVTLVRRRVGELDVDTLRLVRALLRGTGAGSWRSADGFARGLARRGLEHQARVARAAGLALLADGDEDPAPGRPLLRRAVEEAADRYETEEGKQLLQVLLRLVPDLLPGPEGVALLAPLAEAAARERDPFAAHHLQLAVVDAAGRLDGPEARDLVAGVAARLCGQLGGRSRWTDSTWIVCAVLNTCVQRAGTWDDARAGRAVVDPVADALREALARPGAERSLTFYVHGLLLAVEALDLLDGTRDAEHLLDDVLVDLARRDGVTGSVLVELARTAVRLEGARGYAAARRVVAALEDLPLPPGTLGGRTLLEVTSELAGLVLAREGA